MANVSENFLTNLSQSIGISYDLKKNVLGSARHPNSALFNLMQISSLLIYGKPIFGVYEDANSFASITYNSTLNLFQFSIGKVYYQRNLYTIASQSIPVQNDNDEPGTKRFKFYLDYADFELASMVFEAEVTAIDQNMVTVDQLPNTSYLNNFKQVNLNGYLIGVESIDSTTNEIVLYEDVSSFSFVGSTVKLIFQPVVKTLVTSASYGTPPDIDIPSTGIILASALVSVSASLEYSLVGSISKDFVAYPVYSNPADFFPNTLAYNAFLTTVNNNIAVYNRTQTYDIESSLVNSYIQYTQNLGSNRISFDEYWHSQPYKPTDLFQYGTGYQGLQKVDFDKRFKDFWYYFKRSDLTRTLAMFRGDIYGGNAVVGQSLGAFPGTASVSNYIDYADTSTLYNGTFSYGISAVTPSGEYSPAYVSSARFHFNKKVNNYVSWTSSSEIDNLLFFHVYKNDKNALGFEQQRLTNPFEITEYTLGDTILARTTGTLGIGSSSFAFCVKGNDDAEGIIGGIYFNAYLTDNEALTGIQSCLIVSAGSGYVNPYVVISGEGSGAAISLGTSLTGAISTVLVTSFGSGYTELPTLTVFDASGGSGAVLLPVMSKLNCGIFTGNDTQPLGTAIASLEPINIASLPSVVTGVNMNVDNANYVGISSNTYHWAVFTMNTPYALSADQQIKFAKSSGYLSNYATSNDGVAWTTGISSSQIAKLGYLDKGTTGTVTSSRGVFLTNDQAAVPVRLQLYVPNMDLSTLTSAQIGPTMGTAAGIGSTNNLPVQNSMLVYVMAENTSTGVQTTLAGSIPQGTLRGSSILLGTTTDVFDKVNDVFVVPNLSLGVNYISGTNVIDWTIFDFFTVDTAP